MLDELLSLPIQLTGVYLKKYSDNRITKPERLWDNLYMVDKVLQTASEKVFSVIQNITQERCSFPVWRHGYSTLYNYSEAAHEKRKDSFPR